MGAALLGDVSRVYVGVVMACKICIGMRIGKAAISTGNVLYSRNSQGRFAHVAPTLLGDPGVQRRCQAASMIIKPLRRNGKNIGQRRSLFYNGTGQGLFARLSPGLLEILSGGDENFAGGCRFYSIRSVYYTGRWFIGRAIRALSEY